jgi:hypothetical protein
MWIGAIGAGSLIGACSGSASPSSPGTAGSTGHAGTAGGSGTNGTGTAGVSGGGGSGLPSGGGTVSGCRMFPADNPWNQDVSATALHPMAATYMQNMNPTRTLHPDWGTMTDHYGIPYTSGTGATPQPITWTTDYGSTDSDKMPCPTGTNQFCYPIPRNAPIEGGTGADPDEDRHILYIDTAGGPDNCTLYELYQVQNPTGTTGFMAASGAIFHLGSNALRPDGWTSADAAGLPILPGLVRLEEVMAGEIKHALRFTMNNTSAGYIHPATHEAGSSNSSLPPMGLRLRLKASFNTANLSGPSLVIVTAMKKYGIILADNGSDWYFTGDSDNGWEPLMDDLLSTFSSIKGSDFEILNTGPVLTN